MRAVNTKVRKIAVPLAAEHPEAVAKLRASWGGAWVNPATGKPVWIPAERPSMAALDRYISETK